MEISEKRFNKDLILREKLAIERTAMAIERTFLSFVRTALYFIIAGMSINSLLKVDYGRWAEILFIATGFIILIIGIIKSYQHKKRLKANKVHIGDYKLEWEDDID